MVESRCAITSEVRLRDTRSSASWISCSVWLSSAEVASSSTRIGGAFSTVRAIATRCFSPPDSFRPRSPTWVSYPFGDILMKPSICASCAASSTSASLASQRP